MATRRDELAEAATDYVLEHGLIGLSLRPLAAALGTSDRMLLYHFATRTTWSRRSCGSPTTARSRSIRALPPSPGRAHGGARPLGARSPHRRLGALPAAVRRGGRRSGCSGASPTRPRCARPTRVWMGALADHLAGVGLPRGRGAPGRRLRGRGVHGPPARPAARLARCSSDGRSGTSPTPSPRAVRRASARGRSAGQRVAVAARHQQPVGDQPRQAPRRAAPAPARPRSMARAVHRPVGLPGQRHQPAPALPVGAVAGLPAPRRPVVRRVAGRPPGAAGRAPGRSPHRGRGGGADQRAQLHQRDRPGRGRRLVVGQQRGRDGRVSAAVTALRRELRRRSPRAPAPGGRWCRAPAAGGRTRRRARPRPCSRRRRAARAARRRRRAPRRRAAR